MSVDDMADVPAAAAAAAAEAVSLVYIVSAFPSEERHRGEATA
jgi:hypothetical protein